MQVVALRRVGKRLGCEKIILKQGRMQMQFVSNPNSVYYQSAAFDKVLNYIGHHPRRCNLKERNGIRLIDAYSKGVDANIPTSQLCSELVSRILAA